ncbi:MAG TPA: protein translocase subunit SecD [bacterium]
MLPASFRWKIPVTLAVLAWALWFSFPLQERINLGLDLQGGMHLVLKVDTSQVPASARDQDVTAVALEILRNRIDQFGVREPIIQRQGTDHILVQLPGITDRERALTLIGRTALLEFRLVSESSAMLNRALDGDVPAGFELVEGQDGSPYLLESEDALTGAILADAWVDVGQQIGLPVVNFRMTREGAREFGRVTGTNINRRLAIVLDHVVVSAPVIKARITDQGVIEGQFTREEAHDLAITLRAGALPAPIIVEEERTVGPTLGRDSIRAGVRATAIGTIAVVAFMLLFYRFAGLIAVTALGLNFLLVLGALGYFQATLTLPGIAGLILMLGMAVDANVLIYERIREELAAGRPLTHAISAGYDKAFSAIIDSNVTTLVAASFLYWFGTGPIRGFATTLGIGIAASMFTALFVSRLLFDLLVSTRRLTALPMMRLVGKTQIDFLGQRALCWGVSLLAIVIGVGAFIARGPERYGIDFTGGLLQEYQVARPLEAQALRNALETAGVGGAVLQQFGEPTEWLIRTSDDTDEKIQATMAKSREAMLALAPDASPELVRVERVGPTVGPILRQKAWLAILWSLGGILLYVAFRFRHVEFGLAALIALAHDIIVSAGAVCLTGREIDFILVAALMTIAGYSVNDTIVIYDRVRENLRVHRKLGLKAVINLSVNETLSRTVLTSMTTLFVVVALYVAGGEVLNSFAFTLIVGFVAGVYSTIYMASAFVVLWSEAFRAKRA